MTDMQTIQQQVSNYLETAEAKQIPIIGDREFNVTLLARGEYNLSHDHR